MESAVFRASELAELAVAYCDAAMPNASDNRTEDVAHREMYGSNWKMTNIEQFRRQLESEVPRRLRRQHRNPARNVARTVWSGQRTEEYGMGNCDELCEVAFSWLVAEKNAAGVAFYGLSPQGGEFIHAFIVIGVPTKPSTLSILNLDMMPPGWPPTAAWCDPWRREWFIIKDDWQRRVRMVLKDCLTGTDVKPGDLNSLNFELSCFAYHAGSVANASEQ